MALSLARDPAEPFTFADLDAMPEDGRRRELIGGSLVVSPAPLGAHQWCAGRLFRVLDEACPRDMLVIPAPYDWRVEVTGESFQPDLTVIRRGDFDPDGPLRATPLLVVEIISPGREAQDRTFKRSRYEHLGVPAYWIVDPAKPSLCELRLSSQRRYTEQAVVLAGQAFSTGYPFGLQVALGALTWREG
jgi:Uma2 family endonuclease